MPTAKGLGEALKMLRNRRGWPQKQLAAAAKITKGMVSNYEGGKQRPTLNTLDKMMKALGADLCDLYCAVEYVSGRQPVGHDLSRRFQLEPAKPSRGKARKRSLPGAAGNNEGEPGDEGAPRLPEEFERALNDAVGGAHRLLRLALLEYIKAR